MNKLKKLYPAVFSLALIAFTAYAALDTFVIPTKEEAIKTNNEFHFADAEITKSVSSAQNAAETKPVTSVVSSAVSSVSSSVPTVSDTKKVSVSSSAVSAAQTSAAAESETSKPEETSAPEEQTEAPEEIVNEDPDDGEIKEIVEGNEEDHEDEKYSIHTETVRIQDTTIHIVDVQLSHIMYLKTAFANDTYGRNNKQPTSTIAENVGAVFAINGDFHGARNEGIVIRNGQLYRDNPSELRDSFVIWNDGTCDMFCPETETSGEELSERMAYQVFSFGPGLVRDGEIIVTENQEVNGNHIGNRNPRSAIGYIDQNHFVFLSTDGRLKDEKGLTLYMLAEIMRDRGVKLAYNLDGGGSTTMYYNGGLINIPANNQNDVGERSISDIIYIGG